MTTNDGRALARQDDRQPGALAVADQEQAGAAILHYLGTGDLSKLTGEQRAALYTRTCDSLGINSLTRPFDWIEFYDPETKGKKLTLYPRAACADQLAYQHRIRVEVLEEKIVGSLFKVVMRGTMVNGRTETNVSYLDLTDRDGSQLKGQRLGNAFMKAHTKAKRRLIFGMVGMMAPPDIDDLQQARVVTVDGGGNVLEAPTPEQRALAADPRMARTIGETTFEDAPLSAAPIVTTADQRPRKEDLEQPRQERPRALLKASDDDIKNWCGAWFGIVDETPWDTKDARAEFVKEWTATVAKWPANKQTDSLRTMFARCTADEAGHFLSHIRARVAAWRNDQAAEVEQPFSMSTQIDPDDDVAGLSDDEIDARFDAATTRLMGRPRADSNGPTRTQLVAELRQLVGQASQAGASIDLPSDDEIAGLDDGAIQAMAAQLRDVLAAAGAVG